MFLQLYAVSSAEIRDVIASVAIAVDIDVVASRGLSIEEVVCEEDHEPDEDDEGHVHEIDVGEHGHPLLRLEFSSGKQ